LQGDWFSLYRLGRWYNIADCCTHQNAWGNPPQRFEQAKLSIVFHVFCGNV
jgi:hypothetical protein